MEEIKLHQFAEKLELAGYSKRCIDEYPRKVGHFFKYLVEHESLQTIDDLAPEHIKAYQTWVQFGYKHKEKPLSTGGICTRLVALKTFFRLMNREGLLKEDLSRFVVTPKYRQRIIRNVPTQEQMRLLLSSVNDQTVLGIRDRAILELLYATGLRSEELRVLKVEDWDNLANTLLVNGKGSKQRIVPVGSWVVPYLQAYLIKARPFLTGSSRGLLFVSKSGRKIYRANLGYMLRRYAKKVALVNITVHGIRHACATHLLENGADIRYIQELLGHAVLSTTQVYTRVDIVLLKQAHHQYHPRERDNSA